ncbi:zinc finger kinase-like [Raphidocelis subcapitata]|uniref:Zinc finger kinase-like n=1 Tax=Raphidocelis subcapitata TaxID=307507 RepID=A0A2V0P7M4_9CHLO|nr:zinc finger kinase-like [Raphidocelis subcapitata]|eukprot:GBF94922.1 zinc finger kinase-like [Raphidocelis subcapitata]
MGVGSSTPVQRRTRAEACRALPRGASDTCAPIAPVDAPLATSCRAAATSVSDSRLSLPPTPHATKPLKPSWILSSAANANHARRRNATPAAAAAATDTVPAKPQPEPTSAAAASGPSQPFLSQPGTASVTTCNSGKSGDLTTIGTSLGSSSAPDDSAASCRSSLSLGAFSCSSDDGALLQLSPQPSAAPSPYAEGAACCGRIAPFDPQPGASRSSAAVSAGASAPPAAAAEQQECTSTSSSSPLPAPAAAPVLSLPDLMDCLWSGAPLVAVRAEEAENATPASKREGPSRCNSGADELPPGLRNPMLLMPPPTQGVAPVFPSSPPRRPVILHPLQRPLMRQAKALFDAGTFLGRGGEGEVRRVTLDGTDYALKQSTKPHNEARVAHCLTSPWLQMPLAVCSGVRSSNHYALFHLATGSLTDVLPGLWGRACGGLTLPEFRAVAAESLIALGQVHAAGLYHADIKPANFLIAKDGHLCLADFGCADGASEDPIGSGTPVFGAPEQRFADRLPAWQLMLREKLREKLRNLRERFGRRYDFRGIDVWGLAVTWLCLLCPNGNEMAEVVAAAASWRRGPPRGWRPPAWVPAEAAHLIFHCMFVRRPGARVSVRRLQRHAFFAGVDWAAVEARTVPLPLDLEALAVTGQQYWKQHMQPQQQEEEGQQHTAAVAAAS